MKKLTVPQTPPTLKPQQSWTQDVVLAQDLKGHAAGTVFASMSFVRMATEPDRIMIFPTLGANAFYASMLESEIPSYFKDADLIDPAA